MGDKGASGCQVRERGKTVGSVCGGEATMRILSGPHRSLSAAGAIAGVNILWRGGGGVGRRRMDTMDGAVQNPVQHSTYVSLGELLMGYKA